MTDSNYAFDGIQPNHSQGDLEEQEISSEPGHLQEFAYSIMTICTQEQTGELNSEEAYLQIKTHWKDLKQLRKKQKEKDGKGKEQKGN